MATMTCTYVTRTEPQTSSRGNTFVDVTFRNEHHTFSARCVADNIDILDSQNLSKDDTCKISFNIAGAYGPYCILFLNRIRKTVTLTPEQAEYKTRSRKPRISLVNCE